MTVDATGDNLISLQGLGFITFTDEDGGPIGDADEDDRDSDSDDFNEDGASGDQQLEVGLCSQYHPIDTRRCEEVGSPCSIKEPNCYLDFLKTKAPAAFSLSQLQPQLNVHLKIRIKIRN